jgi:formiminotetrahydrofolate cyclodeaminase
MKERYEKVQDNPSLVRDNGSGAIININETAYKARLRQIEETKKHAQQTEKIDKLESDVEEIKNLLKQLVSK